MSGSFPSGDESAELGAIAPSEKGAGGGKDEEGAEAGEEKRMGEARGFGGRGSGGARSRGSRSCSRCRPPRREVAGNAGARRRTDDAIDN
jgi:hypothetical protein